MNKYQEALNLLIEEHRQDRDWTNESLSATKHLQELIDKQNGLEEHCERLEKALDNACARIEWLDAYVGDIIGFEPRDKETWLKWFLETANERQDRS